MQTISPVPAYVLLLVAAGLIVFDCRRDVRQLVSARNVFLLTIMAWFLLEASLLPKELLTFSAGAYVFGLMCVGVCITAFLGAYHGVTGGVFDSTFRRLADIDNPRVLWTVFILACVIGFAPLLYATQGNPLIILQDALNPGRRWSGLFSRARYGGLRDAFMELQMFLRAAIPLGAAILVQPRQSGVRRMVAAAFLLFMFLQAFNSGTRSKVIEVFLPVAAAIYWRLPAGWKRVALLWGLPSLAVLGLLWSAATVLGRNEGKRKWEEAAEADYVGFEMFRELLYIADAVPERMPFRYGRTYFVQAVNPIPRAVWPSKPIDDAGLELAKLKGMVVHGDAYLTVSPGLIGEMYWNGGLIGIALISILLGYLAKSWDRGRPLTTRSVLAFTVFAAGLGIIFLSGRSINAATLYGMLALFVLLVLFSKRAARRETRVASVVLQRPAVSGAVRR